ncbi:MAG TPA: PPOX class F420-dependent oxidoreductase [Candidatus Nitrosocosmicus sp.]
MSIDYDQFNNAKYINLETYRKSGTAVRTPVWFINEGKTFFVVTRANTGKIKRLRNNTSVRIIPCDFRGNLKGKWLNGIIDFINPSEHPKILKLRDKKYGIQSKIISLFTMGKGKYIIISIKMT